MSLVVFSPLRKRAYVRKFDHDEALRRIAAGEAVADLAAEYSVHVNSIYYLLDPDHAAKQKERMERLYKVPCEDCGASCWKADRTFKKRTTAARDGLSLCHRCRSKRKVERVRFDPDGKVAAVHCITCSEWKPLQEFTSSARGKSVRPEGISGQCRVCMSAARKAYRNRNKVPCESCGAPTEGSGRPNTATRKNGTRVALDPNRPYLCRPCSRTKKPLAASTTDASGVLPEQPMSPTKELGSSVADSQS